MCIQDIRLARFVRYNRFRFSGVASNQTVLNINVQRVGFSIVSDNPGTDAYVIAAKTLEGASAFTAVTPFNGICLASIQQYGYILQQQIVIQSPTDALNITVVEFILPEDYLAYAMQEWDTGYTKWLAQR